MLNKKHPVTQILHGKNTKACLLQTLVVARRALILHGKNTKACLLQNLVVAQRALIFM